MLNKFLGPKQSAEDLSGLKQFVRAIERSQATIEFELDGTIVRANDNFLKTMGYSASEIVGKHHRMFVTPEYAASADYRHFWEKLGRGDFHAGKFSRVNRSGKTVWIQASYNPVFDDTGRPIKVVKIAVDITADEERAAQEHAERLAAEAAQAQISEILARCLARLANGDLTVRIEEAIAPVYAGIRNDFNTALTELSAAMAAIAGSSSALHAGAEEIASASDDLSRRTEQQAASLEETAAALDQITATVSRSAEGAAKVANATTEARTDAVATGPVVQSAVKAMTEIEQSSREISKIVSVIDEISFQTNLLALNAGVEAARAGDAGRGFAVVASEVRALAQRCADAAKEIKGLISASTSQVDAGVKLVASTGDALTRIANKIAEIDGWVAEIATSSREQATGLVQVNSAVNQMDQVTQQNAAMVEQATAAAASLQSEAAELTGQISKFQTGTARPSRREREGSEPVTRRLDSRPVAVARAKAVKASGAPKAQDWDEF